MNTIATIIFIVVMFIFYIIYQQIDFKNEKNEILFWIILISILLIKGVYDGVKKLIKFKKVYSLNTINLLLSIIIIGIFIYSIVTWNIKETILLTLILIQYTINLVINKYNLQ